MNKITKPEIVLSGLWGWLSNRLGIPAWGQCVVAYLIVVSLAIGGVLLHVEIRLAEIGVQLTYIPLQISSALVSQSAKQSTNRQYEQAARTLQSASALVEQASAGNVRSKSDYFEKQVKLLAAIDVQNYGPLANQVSQFRVTLATYKSELNPRPELPKETADTAPVFTGNTQLAAQIYQIRAPVFTHTKVSLLGDGHGTLVASFTDKDMLIPDTKQLEINQETISGINMMDGSQSLDGFIWDNVTFINMHIRYTGGTTRLSNVHFVNCTFDLPPDNRGASIADYAALGKTEELKIG